MTLRELTRVALHELGYSETAIDRFFKGADAGSKTSIVDSTHKQVVPEREEEVKNHLQLLLVKPWDRKNQKWLADNMTSGKALE